MTIADPVAPSAADSAFPFERAGAPGDPADPVVTARLRAWARNLTGTESDLPTLFSELRRLGIDQSQIWDSVGDNASSDVVWHDVLEQILTEPVAPAPTLPPVPFADVLAPFASWFCRRLPERGWTPDAYQMVVDDLVAILSRWAARALFHDFRSRQPVRSGLDDLWSRTTGETATTSGYRKFTQELVDGGGLRGFLHRYPVLARALTETTMNRLTAILEIQNRLSEDRCELVVLTGSGEPPGDVAAIDFGGADPHQRGRRVATITFISGERIVYKPRSVDMEEAFSSLLRWLSAHGFPVAMKVMTVLPREGYGWVEHVANDDCADAEDLARFFGRSGALLCLVHILEGTDCHYENVVAHGEYPVLVDCETLLHHRFAGDIGEGGTAMDMAHRLVESSPLRTGYLPHWNLSHDRTVAYDISALGGGFDERSPDSILRWRDVNTDRMSFTFAPVPRPPARNVPRIAGRAIRVSGHEAHVHAGYEAAYRFLNAHANELIEGPIAGFEGLRCRIVLRPTAIYGSLLTSLMTSPSRQSDGFEAGILIEQLGRGYLTGVSRPEDRFALPSERNALYRFDVPVFTADTDGTDLLGDDGTIIAGYFPRASHALVTERIRSLDLADLPAQLNIVDLSMGVGIASADSGGNGSREHDTSLSAVTGAVELSSRLLQDAIAGVHGSLTWIAPQLVAATGRLQLRPLGPGFYDGNSGIAVFFAALHATTGDPAARSAALGCWSTIREQLDASPNPARPLAQFGPGASSGIGSVLYAAALGDQLLGDPEFGVVTERLTSSIKPSWIYSQQSYDVLSGIAGLLLGLIASHRRTHDSTTAMIAVACGEHLLHSRVPGAGGHRAWVTQGDRLLTGFSHGAAGIGVALARLADMTGRQEFLDAAVEAVQYENAVFDDVVGNWPDLRGNPGSTGPRYESAWCHGAPGIAAARLDLAGHLDISGDVRCGIERITELHSETSWPADHLCCGNLGVADVLLSLGTELDDPALERQAHDVADTVLVAAGESMQVSYSHLLPAGVFVPGLFVGAAGIGYQLLRMQQPALLPSVLRFDCADAAITPPATG